MAAVEITEIHNNPVGIDLPSKLNDEYIVIENKSSQRHIMANWIVSDRTQTGEEKHVFTFPSHISGVTWALDPGELIFLMTGKGTNTFVPRSGTHKPQFHFYMQREWFIWNNSGDTAYLRLPTGAFVHWMQVGQSGVRR